MLRLMWSKTDTKTCDNFVGVNPAPVALGGDILNTQELINWFANYQRSNYGTGSARVMITLLEALISSGMTRAAGGVLDIDNAEIMRNILNDEDALNTIARMHHWHSPTSFQNHK